VTGGSAAALNLRLTRDGAGSLTNITDNASTGRGATYAYSPAGRLQQAVGPWGTYNYTFDGAGNMLARTTPSGGDAYPDAVGSFQRLSL
jgi:YD repeat-containing protein